MIVGNLIVILAWRVGELASWRVGQLAGWRSGCGDQGRLGAWGLGWLDGMP